MFNQIIVLWIVVVSIFAYFQMGFDKKRAVKRGRRVSEKALWWTAIIGGGIGSYLGMIIHRHKTKHINFRIGFLLIMIIDVFIIIYCMKA